MAGGGAAGFFAAITCAEAAPGLEVTLIEKGPQFLSKVRISGGGRCNVTHACFEAREFAAHYPRGSQALIGPLQRFQASDTVAWFESRGVKLKTEKDGRMFPTTDSSQTIIDCLLGAARIAGVKLRLNCGIESVRKHPDGSFDLGLAGGSKLGCDTLLLATGGCRTPALGRLAVALGHTLEPPVPSLFTFHVQTSWVRELPGVSVELVEATVPGTGLRECGPILLTHWGLSGPVILRLSRGAHGNCMLPGYRFPLRLNWLPRLSPEALAVEIRLAPQTPSLRASSSIPRYRPLTAQALGAARPDRRRAG